MRVLLDHNLPHKLRTQLRALCEHELLTTSFMQWGHLRNGELLRAAEQTGFDVFLTGDRSMVHEQNLSAFQLAVIALSTNNWPILKNHVPRIMAAINAAQSSTFVALDCGEFSRKK